MTDKLLQQIEQEGAKLVSEPGLPTLAFQAYQEFFQTGNRLLFEVRYFERRRQLATLALAYLLKKEEGLKLALENVIWEVCHEYSWSLPAHFEELDGHFVDESEITIDLFAAETGQTLAEIADLFSDSLAPAVISRIETEVKRRLFQPLLSRSWRWETMANNWSGVVAGSIGLAALAILPLASAEQKVIISRLDKSFKVYLGSFDEDGACVEGIGYWAYGFGYYLYFAEKYHELYKDDRYLKEQKLKAIASFPYKTMINERQFVPFSDATEVKLPTGLLSYCQQTFDVSVPPFDEANSLDFDHCYRWAHLYRNLIWTTKSHKTFKKQSVNYFADAEWLVCRNAEMVFAAKAGGNNESHNHNDVGHFIIGDQHELWLTDLGAGEYTKDYFKEETRYSFLTNRSLGHSVPLINGFEQRAGDYLAKEVEFKENQHGLVVSLNLTDLYPEEAGVEVVTRQFDVAFDKNEVSVTDKIMFKSEKKQQVIQNFISSGEPVSHKEQIVWQGSRAKLVLTDISGDKSCRKESYLNHQGKQEVAYLLQIRQEPIKVYVQRMTFRKI